MKKLRLLLIFLCISIQLAAQKTSGKITYKIASVDFIDKGSNADVTATNDAAKKLLYQLNFNKS